MGDCRCPPVLGPGGQVVLFPKYTTLLGCVASGYAYYSEMLDVTAFTELDLEIVVLSLSGSVDADLETSSDGIQWEQGTPGTGDLPVSAAATYRSTVTGSRKFVRLTLGNWDSTSDRICFWATLTCRNRDA